MHRAAAHHPWMDRDASLLFRGSNLTGHHLLLALLQRVNQAVVGSIVTLSFKSQRASLALELTLPMHR